MFIKNKRLGLPVALAGVFTLLALNGCSSVTLHEPSKSELATSAKNNYESANILGTIAVQRENLAALSAEEMKVVRDNYNLQRDYALLEVADNDTSMGVTWNEEIKSSVEKLGFKSAADLRVYVTGLDIQAKVREGQMARYKSKIFKKTGIKIPQCDRSTSLPDEMDWPTSIDETILNREKDKYQKYVGECNKLLKELVVVEQGALLVARDTWQDAKAELNKRAGTVNKAKNELETAADAHTEATKALVAAGKKGEELRKEIMKSANNLKNTIEIAAKLAPSVVSSERISAITTLLMAAAGEEVDLGEQPNEELAKAVLMVNGLTSISADIAALVASAEAPSISNLLIELQHQTVLLEREKALQALQRERVDIIKAKYLAYLEEADVLLSFRDAMCSFGYLTAGKDHPGTDCDTFSMDDKGTNCLIDGNPLSNCGLTKPWKVFLKKTPDGKTGREFYKALTAFSQLFPIRASQIEQNFKLIDLKHRENLVERESALKAWNNLAAVPIDQIDAYYKSGLKPDQIADLIVKALGFTAVAIGVSQ